MAGKTLTLAPAGLGAWAAATAADRRLLARIEAPRDGDPVNHPARDQVGFLVALCARDRVILTFDPNRIPEGVIVALPSPSPGPEAAGRRNGRHHR